MRLEVLVQCLLWQLEEVDLASASPPSSTGRRLRSSRLRIQLSPFYPPTPLLTFVLTSAGSLHSSSRPLTIPTPKLTGLRVVPSAPESGAGVLPSPFLRFVLATAGPALPLARLPATLGVGEGAS